MTLTVGVFVGGISVFFHGDFPWLVTVRSIIGRSKFLHQTRPQCIQVIDTFLESGSLKLHNRRAANAATGLEDD